MKLKATFLLIALVTAACTASMAKCLTDDITVWPPNTSRIVPNQQFMLEETNRYYCQLGYGPDLGVVSKIQCDAMTDLRVNLPDLFRHPSLPRWEGLTDSICNPFFNHAHETSFCYPASPPWHRLDLLWYVLQLGD